MASSLRTPGDVLEGRGSLLQKGRLIAQVDYHLTIPHQSHFVMNPTGNLRVKYQDHAGGFILVKPEDADAINLTDYILELVNKHHRLIQVERRYKRMDHNGEPRVSFWVRLIT